MSAAAFQSIVQVARLLRVVPGRQELIVVLKAFFDASFTEPTGVTAIGGYMGVEDAWVGVENSWAESLRDWGLSDFHLCDLPHQLGRSGADLCALNFSVILRDSKLHGVTAGLNDADWDELRLGYPDLPDGYVRCLEMMFGVLKQHAELEFDDLPVHVVSDRDSTDSVIQAVFKRCAPSHWTLTIGDRRTYQGIQCSDLSAGSHRLQWLKDRFGMDHFVETRRVLWNLTADRTRGNFWSRETGELAQEHVERLRAQGIIP